MRSCGIGKTVDAHTVVGTAQLSEVHLSAIYLAATAGIAIGHDHPYATPNATPHMTPDSIHNVLRRALKVRVLRRAHGLLCANPNPASGHACGISRHVHLELCWPRRQLAARAGIVPRVRSRKPSECACKPSECACKHSTGCSST